MEEPVKEHKPEVQKEESASVEGQNTETKEEKNEDPFDELVELQEKANLFIEYLEKIFQ